jgi:hypothetical protein
MKAMAITAKQLRLIHIASRQAGLSDPQYRTVLRTVAGVESSKALDQAGFENVMAVLEEQGFGAGSACPARDYWKGRAAAGGGRLEHKICELAPRQKYRLEGLCLRFSRGRTDQPGKLSPRESLDLINMLNVAIEREGKGTDASIPSGMEAAYEPPISNRTIAQ